MASQTDETAPFSLEHEPELEDAPSSLRSLESDPISSELEDAPFSSDLPASEAEAASSDWPASEAEAASALEGDDRADGEVTGAGDVSGSGDCVRSGEGEGSGDQSGGSGDGDGSGEGDGSGLGEQSDGGKKPSRPIAKKSNSKLGGKKMIKILSHSGLL